MFKTGIVAVALIGLVSAEVRAGTAGEVILEGFPVLRQPDPISCGPTCAAMVLRYYGVEEVGDLMRPSDLRVRLERLLPAGLEEALESRGVGATVGRGSLEDLVERLDQGRPAIVLVRINPVLWHYVVVVGYRGHPAQFRLADPYGEAYWVEGEVLDRAWAYDGDLRGNRYGGRPGDASPGESAGGILSAECERPGRARADPRPARQLEASPPPDDRARSGPDDPTRPTVRAGNPGRRPSGSWSTSTSPRPAARGRG